jgi:type II secretory pathway component PulK
VHAPRVPFAAPRRKENAFCNAPGGPERASVLVVVLWIIFGLVAISLYFAHSMAIELRSSDNRVAGIEAEQAIEGARRYLTCMLTNINGQGAMPDPSVYLNAAVPVGDAHYWLIGRGDQTNNLTEPQYGLIDESSKINLNMSNTTVLSNLLFTLLTNMQLPNQALDTEDIVANILAWSSTNTTTTTGTGAESDYYSSLSVPYTAKNAPFETVDELRLVYGVDMQVLYGEDANLNGILDPNENDGDVLPPTDNADGLLQPGLLEYVTIYSQEPTNYMFTNAGVVTNIARVNVTGTPNANAITSVLVTNGISASRAAQIVAILGNTTITSPLQFFSLAQMTADEIAQVETAVCGSNVVGLINVNTASAAVLSCIPGLTNSDEVTQLITYRDANTNAVNGSIGWVLQVLSPQDIATAGPYLTGHTFQYTADVAALGHDGRGFRRTRFVFDVSQFSPVVLYRQDLSHLGWPLGKGVRDKWLLAKSTR